MAISIGDFETALEAINTALDAGDYAAAWKAYAKAEVINQRFAVSGIQAEFQYRRRDDLEGIKKALTAAEAAANQATANTRRVGIARTSF